MDRASAEMETLEREKSEREAREEEKRSTRLSRLLHCSQVPGDPILFKIGT